MRCMRDRFMVSLQEVSFKWRRPDPGRAPAWLHTRRACRCGLPGGSHRETAGLHALDRRAARNGADPSALRGASRRHPQPITVGILEVALAPRQTVLVD